jgi:FlaA1/EpsC-like NDP-sugar epimerase
MIPFDQIAIDLLKAMGLKPDICQTEEEARQKALLLNEKSTSYPIYFFGSETSGEKSFEEFYTENEIIDMDSFINLGVVKNSKKRNIDEIDEIFTQLRHLFNRKDMQKSDVVDVLKNYLSNFGHIEKGKGLDQQM